MSEAAPQRVLVLGGGTAGWMAAASLAHRFARTGLHITLVESSDIGTVGVGEATVPAIRDYVAGLGLDMAALMQHSRATVKLGIEFADWRALGTRFFHPFALYGAKAQGLEFHKVHAHLARQGFDLPLSAFNLGTQLAYAGRFAPPKETPEVDYEVYDWALHFDAGLFADFLKRQALAWGVHRIDATVKEVRRHAPSGNLSAVVLHDGLEVSADLFVDCSGFRGTLIKQSLEQPFIDWHHWLPCDRAVAMPCEHSGDWAPYTRSSASTAGWRWRIPLQHRVGNGHVYASAFLSDDDAEAQLRADLEGAAVGPARRLQFRPGHVQQVWSHNCVALGLAAGFLEPLESTGIALIQSGIERLLALFPAGGPGDPALRREYNRVSQLEYERIRDFIILHYCASARDDSAFWRHCRHMALPDTLVHKIELFKARGHFVRHEWETFQDNSWLSLYAGLGVQMQAADDRLAAFAPHAIEQSTRRMQRAIHEAAQAAPRHEDFLRSLQRP